MAPLWETLQSSWEMVVAVVTVILVLFGYMYNAAQQRSLERNKIQYETKLRAFEHLIDAARAAVNAYESLRGLTARVEQRKSVVEAALGVAVMVQDLESPLGTEMSRNISQRMAELNDTLLLKNDCIEGKMSEEEKMVVVGAVSSLGLVYVRVFWFHHEKLAVAYEKSLLVMEEPNEDYQKSMIDFRNYLWPAFMNEYNRADKLLGDLAESWTPQEDAKPDANGYEEDTQVLQLWGRVVEAMNKELHITL